jgi:hypothetical protein
VNVAANYLNGQEKESDGSHIKSGQLRLRWLVGLKK